VRFVREDLGILPLPKLRMQAMDRTVDDRLELLPCFDARRQLARVARILSLLNTAVRSRKRQ
jgi:hypothetical protein